MNEIEKNNPTDTVFKEGASVVYGLHGRCQIVGIETKKVGGEEIEFYKLEKVNMAIVKPKNNRSFILLPVEAAATKGLRGVISESEANQVWEILGNQEYYFSLEENWKLLQKKVENLILVEGPIGLAKATSYLYALVARMVVPSPDLLKFQEGVNKQLARELAELNDTPIRAIEEKMEETLKNKLKPDA